MSESMQKAKLSKDEEGRTTPIGLARFALDFFEAAKAIDDTIGTREGYGIIAPVPALYCIGRSFELMLKSYLLYSGITLSTLKSWDYGHSLHRAQRKAKELGLTRLHPEEQAAFDHLDNLYASKQLEYIVTGLKTFPLFGPLEHAAARLFNPISTTVGLGRQITGYILQPLP